MREHLLTVLLMLGDGPVTALNKLIGGEIKQGFYLICALGAIILAWMRKFTALVSFGCLMLFVAIFIFGPELIAGVGENLGEQLFKGWSQ
jgi:Na+/phosphate symporter